MKNILVLHGFLSGENNRTANTIRKLLGQSVMVDAPGLPVDPKEQMEFIINTLKKKKYDLIIGNSLGGFMNLALEGLNHYPPRIVINPAMGAENDIIDLIKKCYFEYNPQKSYEFNLLKDKKESIKITLDYLNKLKLIRENFERNIRDQRKKATNYSSGVYGFFGSEDENFHYKELFDAYFGNDKSVLLVGEKHSITDKAIKNEIISLIKKLLRLK